MFSMHMKMTNSNVIAYVTDHKSLIKLLNDPATTGCMLETSVRKCPSPTRSSWTVDSFLILLAQMKRKV